jgi:hypothetical protein
MKSFNSMVPIAPKYQRSPFVASYIFSMSHISGVVTSLGDKLVSKYEESPLDDNEGGVGGLNYTPCLVKPK